MSSGNSAKPSRNIFSGFQGTPQLPPLSPQSTSSVPRSTWCSSDFLLGAGLVILQENTHKVVLVYEKERKYWFLPRGRKDVGESLEQTALREGYEESGYQAQFTPMLIPSRAPIPPHNRENPSPLSTEPIYITITYFAPRRRLRHGMQDFGGEYLITWFMATIPDDAVRHTGTGMPDEQNYEAHLLSIEDALHNLRGTDEARIVRFAWEIWCRTHEYYAELAKAIDEINLNEQVGEEDIPPSVSSKSE